MLEIDFEAYKYIFSVIVGGLFGIIYLTYRVMTNSTGMFTSIADKNEYGDVKILSSWNIGFACIVMMLVFLFFSDRDGSSVNILMHDSWEYLASAGYVS